MASKLKTVAEANREKTTAELQSEFDKLVEWVRSSQQAENLARNAYLDTPEQSPQRSIAFETWRKAIQRNDYEKGNLSAFVLIHSDRLSIKGDD